MSSKIQALFYDISNIVFSPKKGFCDKNEMIPLYKDKIFIEQYIVENNINLGDIIFIGGTGDRQEYYFGIVIENGKYIGGEYGSYIIFDKIHNKHLETIKNKNISYKNVLNEINNNEYYRDLFFGNYDEENIIYDSCMEKYNENNLI